MSVERLDPDRIGVVDGPDAEKQVRQFIEHDYAIRNGLCPNGHGLMQATPEGQECPNCAFSCNVHPEVPRHD